MLVLKYLYQLISKILACRDKRMQHLPFTSPESVFALIVLYLLFVLKWGPKFMKNRQPYNIDRCLLVYNLVQIFSNFTIVVAGIYEINFVMVERKLNFFCEELDFGDSYIGIRSAQMCYLYFLLKILDLFDTIFFVLRKKAQQISFLHVYHHVAILFGAFVAVQWAPGGQGWAFGMLNCFVHFIMYGYYFGSVYSPKLKTNLFIKKSITQMQILQFMLIIAHLSLPFFVECHYPKVLLIIAISQNLIMLLLFADFYYATYIRPKKSKSS